MLLTVFLSVRHEYCGTAKGIPRKRGYWIYGGRDFSAVLAEGMGKPFRQWNAGGALVQAA